MICATIFIFYLFVVYLTMMSGTQDCMLSNDPIIVNDESEQMSEQPWPYLKYYPGIFMEGLRKTMRNLMIASVLAWPRLELATF
jgi:hypothetical protein